MQLINLGEKIMLKVVRYCKTMINDYFKNRSAIRTWGLMLYASMLLFLSVGILFSNVSIWEFNCCK